jgi:CBS domain containing-hemolysin-like protein
MLPTTCFVGLVFFLSLMCFALRVGSLHQLEQVCRDRKRPDRHGRILKARQSALLAFEFALVLVLSCGSWLAAQLPQLQPLHLPASFGPVEVVAWASRLTGVLLLVFLLWLALPRSIARARGGALLYLCWGLLEVVQRMTVPVWNLASRIDGLVHRTAGVEEPEARPGHELSSEILTLVDEGQRIGVIWAGGSRMIHGLLDLHDTDVSSIMTPRIDLVAIPVGTTLKDAIQLTMKCGYSRFPVIRDSVDDVIGVVYARDLLRSVADDADLEHETVESVARPPVYVPESQRIDALIDEMQKKKIQLAIVVDEYSGVAGVVTMEDIMEEIVGEISDEFDQDEPQLMHQKDGIIEADARAHIDDLNDQYQLALPEGADYDTLNGFLLTRFGRIPQQGESYQWRNVRLTVLEADERQLKRVRLEQLESSVELAGSD